MFKAAFIALVLLVSVSPAIADDKTQLLFTVDNGRLTPISKVQAIVHLAQGKQEPVVKCVQQMLSDKATVTNKK